MTTRSQVIPRDENGQRDYFALIRENWPVLVALVLVVMWITGRAETPEQKQERIDRSLAPIMQRLDEHVGLGGHSKMEQRMARIETKVDLLLERTEER